eukprot:512927_1
MNPDSPSHPTSTVLETGMSAKKPTMSLNSDVTHGDDLTSRASVYLDAGDMSGFLDSTEPWRNDYNNEITLEFHHVNFSVHSKKGTNDILKDCSGRIYPGEILAILGPSGVGKTTLLNVLASRLRKHAKCELTGRVLLNGRTYNSTTVKNVTGYVMQDDVLHPSLSPREAIELCAKFRLPKNSSRDQLKLRVDSLVQLLGLHDCQNTLPSRGLSGGELKRMSIATELVGNPRLLLLDEPTSGLDSLAALYLIDLLTTLTRIEKKTCIITIHQPSSHIWELLDKICLIGDGRILYFGPKGYVVEYFDELGYRCPK